MPKSNSNSASDSPESSNYEYGSLGVKVETHKKVSKIAKDSEMKIYKLVELMTDLWIRTKGILPEKK